MSNEDGHLWDSNRQGSDEAFDQKYEEWPARGLDDLAGGEPVFPFKATREEDEDDAYFQEGAARALFRLDHAMEILRLEEEDAMVGIIVEAKENGKTGFVPLCDLEVSPRPIRITGRSGNTLFGLPIAEIP